jgi:hypothetical protein
MGRVLFDPGALSLLQSYKLYPENSGVLGRIVSNGLASGLREVMRTNPLALLLLVVLGGILAAMYALALRGLLVDRRFLDPGTLLLVVTIGYFVTIAGGPVAVGRFRHPAMPFVCALAAAGLRTGYRRRHGRSAQEHPPGSSDNLVVGAHGRATTAPGAGVATESARAVRNVWRNTYVWAIPNV